MSSRANDNPPVPPTRAQTDDPPDQARLSAAEVASRLVELEQPCVLCELACGAMRRDGEVGLCGLDDKTFVYNRLLHMGEEAQLVPSYAVFTTGCNLFCSFCSEFRHLRPPFDQSPRRADELARKIAADLDKYESRFVVRNINFVGGEPSIVLPWIADVLAALDELREERPPALLNTNGYMTPATLALASHLTPIMVVDFKFGNDACASRIAGIERYTEVLRRNLARLHDGADSTAEVETLPVELWVRHLLMPGHLACCTAPVLHWMARHVPDARVNVMPAFVPFGGGENEPWSELTAQEKTRGRSLLDESGIRLAYFDGRKPS